MHVVSLPKYRLFQQQVLQFVLVEFAQAVELVVQVLFAEQFVLVQFVLVVQALIEQVVELVTEFVAQENL